jgi:GABA permease
MRSPFRSEVGAFHFLLFILAALAAVAVASILGGVRAGLPVWAVATAGAALFYLRRGRRRRGVRTAPAHVGAADERRILLVAGETAADHRLVSEIEKASAGVRARVLVLCPPLVSPLRRWTSDVDGPRAQAEGRLDDVVGRLRARGIEVRGEVGDEDPVRAIEDALRTFGADEIVISTHPEGDSTWLERGVVARARERFALPLTHVTG